MLKPERSWRKLEQYDLEIEASRRMIIGGEAVPVPSATHLCGSTMYLVPERLTDEDRCAHTLLSLYEGRTPRNY